MTFKQLRASMIKIDERRAEDIRFKAKLAGYEVKKSLSETEAQPPEEALDAAENQIHELLAKKQRAAKNG